MLMMRNIEMFEDIIQFIRSVFQEPKGFIPLHAPKFVGREKEFVTKAIETTFVSSVGEYVTALEHAICEYTGSKYAVATANGTAALHVALVMSGAMSGDEVITQALSFVATANAITYTNAKPVFVDIDRKTLGMSAMALEAFLQSTAEVHDDHCYNVISGNRLLACVPMHSFGFPCDIEKISRLCKKYKIALIEDAAESLGSSIKAQHTGTFGKAGIISFNGNKTITSGGGGVVLTKDALFAKHIRHITTTAKVPHKWEYHHDQIGYNYRMPNLNAALACAQLENLPQIISSKRKLAAEYKAFFDALDIRFVTERKGTNANYWLNCLLLKNKHERDAFLTYSNEKGVMTRPAWEPLNRLKMFANCHADSLENTAWLAERLVCIPSSPRL